MEPRHTLLFVALSCACMARDDPTKAVCSMPVEAPLSSLRLHIEGRVFRDALGRQVLLRGVNAGGRSKFAPFFPFEFRESQTPGEATAPPFEEALAAYADRVEAWGLNAVRLPFVWEAIEPTRGRYDELFLDRYAAMAAAFGKRGIRVLVDFHEDVFARPYCGDGFPLWACPEPVPERPADCSAWFMGCYTNPDVKRAFDRFWNNEDGLQDSFVALWRHVAGRMWSAEGVIGFDVINEPCSGTAPADAWATGTLPPFYSRLALALQETAPGALVFVEPSGFDGPFARTSLARPDAAGIVLAPHFYDPGVFLSGAWTGDHDLGVPLGRWDGYGDAWQTPVFIGEFGISRTASGAAAYIRANVDALDALLLHATLWEYSQTSAMWNSETYDVLDGNGAETDGVAALIRAFPRAVAGKIRRFVYDASSRTGTLEWDASAGGVTEVSAPVRLYPEGVEASLEGAAGCTQWRSDRGVLVALTREGAAARLTFGPRR
jgi:endoglycosylceramidase